ncbi:MAG: DUF4445 domain-containing protein [Deltaproteobacteria bacterium]|nr:MAG: DUF4445 domain-containing protein [Deltaproteobacteria bacterium]
MGMQAATGAIDQVTVADTALRCRVIGGGPARGICGSGLVDAVACGLDLGWIDASGRLEPGRQALVLSGPVHLTQRDVRQLQLAKAAIAAALALLTERWGIAPEDLSRVYLAGAFGNYVNCRSARRIGLVEVPENRLVPAGNTALLGAKLALFTGDGERRSLTEVRSRIEHVSLAASARFHEVFVSKTAFPA